MTRPNPVQKSRDKEGQLGSYASTNDQILEQMRQSEQICIREWRCKSHMVHNQNRRLVIWISTLNGQGHSWLCLQREKSCKCRLFGKVLRERDPVLPWFSNRWVFAGHALAFPFHSLHGLMLARCWMHKLVTNQLPLTWGCPEDQAHFWVSLLRCWGQILQCFVL